jgi:hypothetical protein
MRHGSSAFLAVGAAMIAGCASFTVTDEAIVDRTAFALGLNKGDFTVSNRTNEGVSTRYAVRTKSGQEYQCVIGGSLSVLGRQASEALCSKKGEPMRNPLLR